MGDSSCAIDQWIDSLEEIIDKEFDLIIPGHGPVCSNSELAKHSDFMQRLRDSVEEALSDGLGPEEYLEHGFLPAFYEDTRGHRTASAVRRAFELYRNHQ